MVKKKNNHKGLQVFIIILIILLAGAIAYICYEKNIFDSFIKKEPKVETKKEIKEEPKMPEEEVIKLHDSLLTNSKHYGFYFERKVSNEEIPPYTMIQYAFSNYLDEKDIKVDVDFFDKISICGEKTMYYFCNYNDESDEPKEINNDVTKKLTVSKDTLNKYIKDKFNIERDFSYINEIPVQTQNNYFYAYYNSENKEYYLATPHRALESIEISSKYIKSEQKNDEITIYSKPIICTSGEGGTVCQKYLLLDPYSYDDENYSKSALLSKQNDGNIYDKNNKKITNGKKYIEFNEKKDKNIYNFDLIYQDFESELNTYKSIFKKADDGNYYWYSSEPIK